MTADLADLFAVIANAFRLALGDDLLALDAYGSGADGSYIPGFSDLDLAAFCDGMPSREALLSLGQCCGDLEISPFSYLQVRYIDANEVRRQTLVAGSVQPLTQPLADIGPYLYDDEELSPYASRWLAGLSSLLDDDLATWSVCAGRPRRLRHLRLVMTRVKPTVRSLVTRSGVPATRAFSTSWPEAIRLLHTFDAAGAAMLERILSNLPPSDDDAVDRATDTALRFLAHVVDGAVPPVDAR